MTTSSLEKLGDYTGYNMIHERNLEKMIPR